MQPVCKYLLPERIKGHKDGGDAFAILGPHMARVLPDFPLFKVYVLYFEADQGSIPDPLLKPQKR